ncbi:tetrathionate reductase subunit B precursor [mine drainage metagenome]|uniref:Tetrathionate reductase subunit B n=1 Tax=mine drainage metagenome TaxID=410659 RepID=A0A1J5T2F2_9ZZZZ
MKRVVQHPEPSELSGPRYWRSLGELTQSPGFKAQLEREFPEGASSIDGVDRRHFLKIMAASFALGGLGLSGCRRPELHILPFGKSVENAIPGLPLYYASAMPIRGYALPILAETHQGRPTKIEGNPTYAAYGGASTLLAQASLLELYDPDRATAHLKDGAPVDPTAVAALVDSLGGAHEATKGAGLVFLADRSSSPTRARLVKSLRKRFPKSVWAEYEPVRDEAPVEAALACFGRPVKPLYRFAKAKRIVSLDSDFLGTEADNLAHTRDFSQGRRVLKPTDEMNRLYVAESGFTVTGAMADHRLRLASSHILAFAAALAVEVTGNHDFEPLTRGLEVKPEWIKACAADLLEHRGTSLVVAGSHQPAQVHAIAYAINAFLGNIQRTIDFAAIEAPDAASIQDVAKAIQSGGVKTLVILNGNPVYNAPVELEFASLLKKVPQVVRYGYYVDETSVHSHIHLAATHYLEAWGDARTIDGTIVPIQPMIMPLFNGLTEVEVLARLAGESVTDPYTQVFNTVTPLMGGDSQRAIEKFLHDGLAEGTGYSLVDVNLDASSMGRLFRKAVKFEALSETNLEIRFIADYKVDDGRFTNNGWLQECPDPMTRLAWDNAILISPKMGKWLGVAPKAAPLQVARVEAGNEIAGKENAPIAELMLGGRKIRGPIHIQPGLSDYTVVLPLGYGRTRSGRIGNGSGFSAYAIRTSEGAAYAVGGRLTLTGEHVLLADAQEHWSMEGRDLIREANYQEYRKHPDYVKDIGLEAETPPVYGRDGDKYTLQQKVTEIPRGNSLYKTPEFTGPDQWGMSIDLNVCTGCNACVVACQSENNIPIVGRDQVIRGREMHWIRIDRYFSDGKADAAAFGGPGNRELPEDPQASLQPVACQQCELAPCEMVCPVAATVHDSEGLNVMAYNRCIGTRYCANNCPYKVRRFNYFDWNQRELNDLYMGPLGPEGMPELLQMAKNPEVTVRMRGVMEKCTYCVQRIENGKIQWKAKMAQAGHPGDVVPPDGFIKTACQQACPAGAIVFGNILDTESEVAKAKAREQDYALLGYLNTRPRTTYLGKLRNPNPKMPDYRSLPLSRIEYENKSGESRLKKEEAHES